jgi:hypothetical protein
MGAMIEMVDAPSAGSGGRDLLEEAVDLFLEPGCLVPHLAA